MKDIHSKHNIDWVATGLPLVFVIIFAIVFFAMPGQSTNVVEAVRHFVGDTCGVFFAALATFMFVVSIYLGCSRYGNIKLGNIEKPEYSSFKWGSMIFTGTFAADMLFYSLCEWALYATEPHVQEMGGVQDWANTYAMFHWGPVAWGFFIVLAVCFSFMLHVRGCDRQKVSEACRPLLGKRVEGGWGRAIDLVALFALLTGSASSFAMASPLLSATLADLLGIDASAVLTIIIFLIIAIVYIVTVWFGMKGVAKLAVYCTYVFFVLLAYVFLFGGEARYTLESGLSSLGNMVQNLFGLSTYTDPLRTSSFPQNWTFYYWSSWMSWGISTPFFIAMISKGRTVRQVVFGGYLWGLAGTFASFIVMGNYGMAQELIHGLDVSGFIAAGGDISQAILKIVHTLPLPTFSLILLSVSMIGFTSTTFDALAMVISSYSYKRLPAGQEPGRKMLVVWSVILVLMPVALLFTQDSLNNLQSVSIIGAFPLGFIILLIVACFFKEAGGYLKNGNKL